MPDAKDRILLPYGEARGYIMDADVLLYSGRSLLSKCIKSLGRTRYSHAAMAGWSNGVTEGEYSRLFVYEMLITGGAGTSLSAHAEKWPGTIDVYRVADIHSTFEWDPTRQVQAGIPHVLDRRKAVSLMKDFCRPGEYGWWHLWKASLLHFPILRFFSKMPADDELEDRSRPPHCSEAISYALRNSFTDVVRNTPDHYTEPGELSRSPLLHYMFTLVEPMQENLT